MKAAICYILVAKAQTIIIHRAGLLRHMEEFYDYMRFRHPLVKHRWTKDYSTFKRLGYVVERRNMCRACKRTAVIGCKNSKNF
jgi:hypothetical protein